MERINLNDDFDLEEDEANKHGNITQKKRWTKALNLKLVSCWLSTSKDLIIGVHQSSNSYWLKIANQFNELTGESRTAGCYKRARNMNCGEWSEINFMQQAHLFFEQEKGKSFNLVYWWEAVKDEVKWNDMYMQEYSSKRSKINDSGAYTTSSGATTTNEDTINASRPIGQKAAKKNKGKNKVTDAEEFVQQVIDIEARKMAAMEKMTFAQQALADAQKFNVALAVLSKDTSHMSEDQRTKHEHLCEMLCAQFFNF